MTILVCIPINVNAWSRSPQGAAAPQMVLGKLKSLSGAIVPTAGAPSGVETEVAKAAKLTSRPAEAAPVETGATIKAAVVLPPALGVTAKNNPPAPVITVPLGSAQNSYSYGQCTWYVASRRSIPGHWGNARNWYSNAQATGYKVGASPAVNAIAWTSAGWAGHVALVEDVDGDRVLIAEMNNYGVKGGGWNRIDRRWVNASEFKYIY